MNCPLCSKDAFDGCMCCGEHYFTIADKDGHLIHTHLSTLPHEAVEDFMKTEQVMNELYNAARSARAMEAKCAESWEVWEAKGYRIAKVIITELPNPSPARAEKA